MPRQYRNVTFTWNNPDPNKLIDFDPEAMRYLVYQLEKGEEGETPHWQGYMELEKRLTLNGVKTLLGCNHVHIEARRGTARQASDYCKKLDTRVPGQEPHEHGNMSKQGARHDLEGFKDAVLHDRKRKRDVVDEHFGILAKYPKFYTTLTELHRPAARQIFCNFEVILHIGDTGLGKTKTVFEAHGEDPEFYVAPLSNGTTWYDGYDRHKIVLLDDFAGAASHVHLDTLLRLLDVYPQTVPVKGGHVWWVPDTIYVTTNILPKDWYRWITRGNQYLALARRFTKVVYFYKKISEEDPGFIVMGRDWWKENCPPEARCFYSP